MRYDAVLWLITDTLTTDEYGNQPQTEDRRRVYANQYSMPIDATYAASARGMDDMRVYEIQSRSYAGERRAAITLHGDAYEITSVNKNGDRTRLTLELVATKRGGADG